MQEEPEFDDETNITLDSLETSPNTTEINTESINLEDSPVLKGINDKIFKFNKWQDKWAMGVFATHLFVVILLLISGGVTGFFLQYLPNNHQDHQPGDDFNTPHNSTDTKYNPYDDLFDYFTNTMSLKEIARVIVATIICAIVGAIISFIWLLLNLKFARGMVYMCLIFSVIICIFISIFYFTIGGWILGSSLVIVNFIFFMCFFLWWKRMPFSAILSTAVAQLLLEIRTIIFATIFVIIIYTLWYFFFSSNFFLCFLIFLPPQQVFGLGNCYFINSTICKYFNISCNFSVSIFIILLVLDCPRLPFFMFKNSCYLKFLHFETVFKGIIHVM